MNDRASWNVVRELSIPVYAEDGAAWCDDGRELPAKLHPLVCEAGGKCHLDVSIRLSGRAEFCRESSGFVSSLDRHDVESMTLVGRRRSVVVPRPLVSALAVLLADDIESFCEEIAEPDSLSRETGEACGAAS